jgi:hypothetical protein
MTDFSKVLADTGRTAVTWPVIEVSFTAPDGGRTTITVKPEQLGQKPFQMPGPAEVDPSSPEGVVMHLMKEDYGDGSLILLDKNDPQFEAKSQALRDSDRRFDKSAGGWVRK